MEELKNEDILNGILKALMGIENRLANIELNLGINKAKNNQISTKIEIIEQQAQEVKEEVEATKKAVELIAEDKEDKNEA
jgi:outer membrane murein-binding lipoprotein Lpp